MIECNICHLKDEGYNYSFAISHSNCTYNLHHCKTESDFARLITEDVETYRDIDLMKLNFKCTKKYLISKGYSNDFIKKVKHLCNKYAKTLKSGKLIEDTIEEIMKKIERFSRAERKYVLDQVDVRFWNERR